MLTGLSPLSIAPIRESVRETGRLAVVEEGTEAWGVGAEIVAQVAEGEDHLPFACTRVAALNVPIPSARDLEIQALPSPDLVQEAILKMTKTETR